MTDEVTGGWNTTRDAVFYVPNLTYPATLNAFLNSGCKVQIVDTDINGHGKVSDDYDFENRGDAHCHVGLFGANPPIETYPEYIIDGAQHWLVADYFGVGMAISFDPTKNLNASGNGGAILTNSTDLYHFAKAFRNNGKDNNFYTGTNSKMSEIDCAHVLVRSAYIDQWQERRKEIRRYYLKHFEKLPIRCLSRDFPFHMDQKFAIYYTDRNKLQEYLTKQGIETRIHYAQTLSELPVARDLIKPDMISTSTMLSRGLLSLPIHPELTDAEVEYITNTMINFFDTHA